MLFPLERLVVDLVFLLLSIKGLVVETRDALGARYICCFVLAQHPKGKVVIQRNVAPLVYSTWYTETWLVIL